MVVAAVAAGSLQRRLQLVEADRAVAVGIELVKDVVGGGEVGATGAERAFEFRFADRAVAIAVDLREQVLQRADGLVDAVVWLFLDDWLCAASSALMVCRRDAAKSRRSGAEAGWAVAEAGCRPDGRTGSPALACPVDGDGTTISTRSAIAGRSVRTKRHQGQAS